MIISERETSLRVRLVGFWGIARSIGIYYAIPGRGARMRRFYKPFVVPESLCFDLGAHVGNRTHAWRRLGAKVVAVEPQPACVAVLRRLFGRDRGVTIVPKAIGAQSGEAMLYIDPANPTISTLSESWIAQACGDPGFSNAKWKAAATVPVTTLQALIVEFGRPAFVKIDVEGLELDVLNGLSEPLPCLSFEYLPASRDSALACIDRLEQLGPCLYNRSPGESLRLAGTTWLDADAMRRFIAGLQIGDASGDIYARLQSAGEPVGAV